jgi:hypothetical protein
VAEIEAGGGGWHADARAELATVLGRVAAVRGLRRWQARCGGDAAIRNEAKTGRKAARCGGGAQAAAATAWTRSAGAGAVGFEFDRTR